MAERVRLAAPAKVNLRLGILAREASGFHSLESLFCALALADEVELERGAPGIHLEVGGGVDTGPPGRNLAVRAAERFHAALGRPPALRIRLCKRIPAAAGLGGGSSDAAATLLALNALEGSPFDRASLGEMAIGLGSDVPFFVCGSPLAWAWGRGERLLALPPLPARPVLVAHPGTAVPTPEAFAAVAARRAADAAPRAWCADVAALGSWGGVKELQGNDFEEAVVERIPRLGPALAALRGAGAEVARLAGSGGCVFGVFAEAARRDAAAAAVEALGLRTWSTQTLVRMPVPRVDPAPGEG